MGNFDRQSVQSFFFKWAGVAALLASGLVFILNGLFWLRAESSTGEVVGMQTVEHASAARTPTVRFREEPLVSFETAGGETVEFQASQRWSFGDNTSSVGDSVPVLYLSAEPQKARLRSGSAFFLAPLFFMAIGGVAIYVGEWLRS